MIRIDRTFWPTLLMLMVVLALSELTRVDIVVQDRFFDFDLGRWAVDRTAWLPRLAFYDAPKIVIIAIGVTLLAVSCGPKRWRRGLDRRALVVGVLTLATVPALVGAGKATTNIFCPSEIRRYGGEVPYVRLCEPYSSTDRPTRRGRCFPAGHASGGFALLGLVGLARTSRGQKVGMALALAAGGAMGIYQMAKGAHYLSHTLMTMLVAWWIFLFWRRVLRLNPPNGTLQNAKRPALERVGHE